MPRHTKLTPERQEQIVELLRAGNYVETACKATGISENTFYKWLKLPRSPYVKFREAVEKAQAEAEARNLLIIQKAAQETWQAAAWFLERKWPDRWGRRMSIEGGSPEKPVWIANARDELLQKLSSLDADAPEGGPGQLPDRGNGERPALRLDGAVGEAEPETS